MSINAKTKSVVDGLLTDVNTTETSFKTGLTDVTSELDTINTTINTSTSNAYGLKTISTSAPSGGSDGDIWYRYE